MKQIKFNLPAFSLAEALITLLIVCLITLASIPILTKKKRNPNEAVSGKWMCTLKSNGKYVVYSSSDPHGDITNPNTWRTLEGATGCTFVPPQNAKNFGVTVIGGGGGGRDGKSELNTYLDENHNSYIVEEDKVDPSTKFGVFRLAVIGNGGGGTGSDDSDGCPNCGVGGQGGGGAYWIGEIKLRSGWQVSGSISNDGLNGASDDGSKAGWPGVQANKYYNVFSIEGHEYIKAGNGGAGQATVNKGGAHPKGGAGGSGGVLQIITQDYGNLLKNPHSSQDVGIAGRQNSNCKYNSDLRDCAKSFGDTYGSDIRYRDNGGYPCYGKTNSIKLGGYYNNIDNSEFGLGGYGCRAGKKTGLKANKGTVKLWQIIKRPGGGGSAAKLSYYSLPYIKGSLRITIGDGGEANRSGQRTVVQYYNLQNVVERSFYGEGGSAGVQGNLVSTDEVANGEVGQNSLWLNKGGGTFGQCSDTTWENTKVQKEETVVQVDENGEPICEQALYYLGPVFTTPQQEEYMMDCPLNDTTPIKGKCFACNASSYGTTDCGYRLATLDDGTKEWYPTGKKAIMLENKVSRIIETGAFPASSLLNNATVEKWNTRLSSLLNGYQYSSDDFICIKYKTVIRRYEVDEPVEKNVPSCSDSGPGTYFGAGGGGGSTSDKVGIFGRGGKGAPGAVIIEW